MLHSRSHRRWGALVVLVLTVAGLLPFLSKPLHIDDPLFLWSAQQIRHDPLDFYGTPVNWYGFEQPLSEVTKNPPLVSYAIAAVAWLAGTFDERTLHVAFLAPAAAATLGTWFLAARLGAPPTLAALLVLASPAFLTSATSVMCDVPMLACFVWAVFFWIRGVEERRTGSLWAAGVLATAATLAKYFGLTLVPLLALYALWRVRRVGGWCIALLLPLVATAAYQWGTAELYAHGLVSDAIQYAARRRGESDESLLPVAIAGLAFLGACGPALFFAPVLAASWRWVAGGLAVVATLAGVALALGSIEGHPLRTGGTIAWPLVLQIALHAAAGLLALGLAALELARRRSADAALLFAWLLGTFVFAAFVNWTINARTLLPLLPALAILIARRLAERSANPWRRLAPLAPAAALSLSVACADLHMAENAQEAALAIGTKYAEQADMLWFQGHWGFQYYMQGLGLRPLDRSDVQLRSGDLLATPMNNNLIVRLPGRLRVVEKLVQPNGFVTVMNRRAGAGFYTSLWGPLPYAFGSAEPDETWVEEVVVPTLLRAEPEP